MSGTCEPKAPGQISRRRVLRIVGALAGTPLLATDRRAAPAPVLYEWKGTSLGCPSRLLLYHPSRSVAEQAAARCAAEIERLERVFALNREDSEIALLNKSRRITAPSHDLLTVLSLCETLWALSGGAFDPTVQPLWRLYAGYFYASRSPGPAGPNTADVATALALVDWRQLDFGPRSVALARSGTGLTLNGIAQGYVTDRITEILRQAGFDHILADLGRSELRVVGGHPDGRPWRIGLADPRQPERVALTVPLTDCSLCTSGGYGTKFESSGRFHHLFDPATGGSANRYLAISVFAPSAMVADGLSTALYVAAPEAGRHLLERFPDASAIATLPDGATRRL